jgi:phytoene desaturase
MARVAEDLGVEIATGDEVREILFEGRRAVGVRSDSGVHPADALVINADFARAMTRLVPDALRRRWTDAKIARKKFSCSTFMLYLGIEGRYDVLDHHTIFLARDYRRNIREIEEGRCPPGEPSIYVQNPSRTDPAFGDAAGSSLYVLVPVGHCGAIDWAKERDGYRDLILNRLEALGLENLRARIRYEKVVTPDDWATDLAIHRGATFNLAHNLGQLLYFRPHNRFEDVDGVYLVGGGTHPGSGLPVIYEGARITADLILQDLGLEAALPALG